jgi:hypothetical protein
MIASGRAMLVGAGGVLALAAAGCGSTSSYKNEPRPPSPIVVSASISDQQVSVSPDHFGAGPIDLVITNQSSKAQRLVLEPHGQRAGQKTATAPIDPTNTAELKADVAEGRYSIRVSGTGIHSATLRVGHERPSAQNKLLQP